MNRRAELTCLAAAAVPRGRISSLIYSLSIWPLSPFLSQFPPKAKEKNQLIQQVWTTSLPAVENLFKWDFPFSLCHPAQNQIADPMGIVYQEGKPSGQTASGSVLVPYLPG